MLIFHPKFEVPDRINATSPSRLATRARPGANFTVAVQLVGLCPSTGAFMPAPAPHAFGLVLHVACEVAKGMAYLHSKRVVALLAVLFAPLFGLCGPARLICDG